MRQQTIPLYFTACVVDNRLTLSEGMDMSISARFVVTGAFVLLVFGLALGNTLDAENRAAQGDDDIGLPRPLDSGGPDAYGYYYIGSVDSAFNAPVYNWREISSYGTEIPFTGDDQNMGPYLIGFTFNFYGVDFLTFRVCSNGWVSFTSTSSAYSNEAIPSAAEPNDLVAAFWDDLDFGIGGDAYYYSNNADTLIVEWKDVAFHIGDGTASVQAIITANGNILFQYGAITGANNSHTIGIENQSGLIGLQYIYNTARDESNKAILFTRAAPDYGAHDVLILSADADTALIYRNELAAFADIDQADFFNGRTGTPTLSFLQNYDAVVIWTNNSYQDPVAVGNVLADYLDAGGAVVMHSFSFYANYNVQGRLMDDYSPFTVGTAHAARNLGVYDAGHPIMVGADSLSDRWTVNVALAHSAIQVAAYSDGVPAVAYNPVNNLVAINGYVGSQNRQFSGDMIRISHNAIMYAIDGPGEVLFLMADGGATYTKRRLEEYWDIHGVDYYNARYASPTLAFLQRYDAVVVWSNNSFDDPVVLGNRLADYIDLGGSVVIANFCFGSGWEMGGRLMSSYSPFGSGPIRFEDRTLGVHNPGHFLMNGVTTATDYFTCAVTVQNGGVSIASWDDSTPFVAYHPATRTVAINGYYGMARNNGGDMIPLLHNAINFSRNQTGIGDFVDNLPGTFELRQNYPNPFNPTTEIAFELPRRCDVTLEVFNVLGQRVTRLPQGTLEAGSHSVIFDGAKLGSGVYFYRLEADGKARTKQMVILK